MSRRHHAAPLPDCEHTIAARASWETERDAWVQAAPAGEYRNQYEYRREHPIEGGLCAVCALQWWSESPWRPELWNHLDASAANGYRNGRLLLFDKPAKLPPAPKPRQEKETILRARLVAELAKQRGANGDTRAHAMIGTIIGPDRAKRWYTLVETNGHCALIEPTAPPADRQARYASMSTAGAEWIDLPADFHLALKRVRLLANERSTPIRFAYDGFGPHLTLSASCPEYGEARETVPIVHSSEDATPSFLHSGFTCCLSAEYVDLVCGLWPLRWYLSPPEERSSPADRYSKARTWTEELPQHFQPAGADWHFVIMPMKI